MISTAVGVRLRGASIAAAFTLIAIGTAGCTADAPTNSVSGTSSPESASSPSPTNEVPAPTKAPAAEPDTDAAKQPDPDPDRKPDAEPALGPTEQPELPVTKAKLDEKVEFDTGMTVSLEDISITKVEAETPGDIPGDAVEIVVRIANGSKETQNVDSAVVTLETADGDIGLPTIAGGASPLSGDIAPRKRAEGRYLFILDPVADRKISVSVNYAAGEPVARFTGRTP